MTHGWTWTRFCAVMAAAALTACSSVESPVSGSGSFGSFRERMNAILSGGAAGPTASGPTTGASNVTCPPLDIRQGASTLMSNAAASDASVSTLRYQATIGQMARECAVRGGNFNVKVGVHGRVILGPAGAPGTVDVPLRLALVREGMEPKTIWTKLYRIPVTVPSGQNTAPFLHIEEDLTVPMPPGDELDAYIIYVGFDPLPVREPAKRPSKKRG